MHSLATTSETAGEPPAVSPLLDGGTQLPDGPVAVSWWPSAGESVAYLVSDSRDAERLEGSDLTPEQRAQENRDRSLRRSRSRLRRMVVSNALTRLVTLTFAPGPVESDREAGGSHASRSDGACMLCGRPFGEEGYRLAMRRAARFIERLREALGGEDFAYALVPEPHKDGHLHIHLALGFAVERSLVASLWPFGFEHQDPDDRKVRSADGGRAAARKAAAYLCKYLSKSFEAGAPGRHRYEVSQGFQPAVVKRGGFATLEAAIDFVTDHAETVVYRVCSEDLPEYRGPPFIWCQLDPYEDAASGDGDVATWSIRFD